MYKGGTRGNSFRGIRGEGAYAIWNYAGRADELVRDREGGEVPCGIRRFQIKVA